MEFPQWRFNLRGSNTEPLVRLNVESRRIEGLMREKTEELLRLIDEVGFRTVRACCPVCTMAAWHQLSRARAW